MNTPIETARTTETSLTRDWINLARYYFAPYLSGRRGLIILTVAVFVIGLALNWSWLLAIGVAPLLISLAPCAVMCTLGLCMSRMGGKSCSTQSPATREETDAPSPSAFDVETSGAPIAREGDELGSAHTRSETANDRS